MTLPSGTVTLLFTDVEGSTRLVQRLGDEYGHVLAEVRRLLREAVAQAGGREVDCRADELFAVFESAKHGVAAAVAAQRLLATHEWAGDEVVRVRMGLHTGEPAVEGGAYLGVDVTRAARICAAGHGGQILLSQTTGELIGDAAQLQDLGEHPLAGLTQPVRIFQLVAADLRSEFPPLRAARPRRRPSLGTLPIRRSRQLTLEDVAWQVRALLPSAQEPLQAALAELGAALFTAHRALAGADRFFAQIDHKRLVRRHAEQQKMAVISKRARTEMASLQAQIASVEQIRERRHALALLAAATQGSLDELHRDEQITRLKERVAAVTAELDRAVADAARALDPLGYKLKRTRYPGVFRRDKRYVVPYVDELGGDRRREFETLAAAHDFHKALRIAAKAQEEFTSEYMKGGEWGGGGGTGPERP